MLQGRFASGMDSFGTRTPKQYAHLVATPIKKSPFEELKNFYADVASFEAKATIECGLDFFGADHLVFASDMPFGPGGGYYHIAETIKLLEKMDLSKEDREKIFAGNVKKMFNL